MSDQLSEKPQQTYSAEAVYALIKEHALDVAKHEYMIRKYGASDADLNDARTVIEQYLYNFKNNPNLTKEELISQFDEATKDWDDNKKLNVKLSLSTAINIVNEDMKLLALNNKEQQQPKPSVDDVSSTTQHVIRISV